MVDTYSPAAARAMAQVLDLAAAGWPQKQAEDIRELQNCMKAAPAAATAQMPSQVLATNATISPETAAVLESSERASKILDASDFMLASTEIGEADISGTLPNSSKPPTLKKSGKKIPAKSTNDGGYAKSAKPQVATAAVSLLQKMQQELQARAKAKRQMSEQLRAERNQAAVPEDAPQLPEEPEPSQETSEDRVLFQARANRWSRRKQPAEPHVQISAASAKSLPQGCSQGNKPSSACTKDDASESESEALALDLLAEAEAELDREGRQDDEGFW